MPIDDLAREWQALGEQDAFDAILTVREDGGGEWDVDEFFATAAFDIEHLFTGPSDRLGLPERRGSALDFGCGLGRLTQALADHFDRAVGVDIAPAMIEGARGYNRKGDRVEYIINVAPDLSILADRSFDLVFSTLVLQHMEPALSTGYIAEFVRLCAPGGLIYFQIPDGQVLPTPLSQRASRAGISIGDVASPVAAGSSFDLTVELRNDSAEVWPGSPSMIGVGDHWIARGGRMAIHDDARAHLTEDLRPGEAVTLSLTARAPDEPGTYELEVEAVQEMVRWFSAVDPGSRARTTLDVVRGEEVSGSEGPTSGERKGRMELHSVPRGKVEEILVGAGAQVLEVIEAPRCGPAWLSYEYYATVPA